MNAEQIWQPVILEENREPVSHREPGEEFLFYRAVAAGLIDAVQENCDRGAFENLEGTGRLSNDPVTNLRYHFVVATAMITRFCTEGGMPMEEAFSLSDEYIRRMDCCTNIPEIIYVHHQMAMDFVCRMRQLHRNVASSKQVAQAIEYIRQRKIDMAKNLLRFSGYDYVEIAVMLSYSSQSHFIQHFRSQTGMTPKAYRKQNYLNNWNVNREPAT